MSEDTVLAAIGSTEETTFGEFCRALGGDCPDTGDRDGWREVMGHIRTLERHGFIEVARTQGRIDAMVLTEAGANRIREKLDGRRGLLSVLK
jgi:DNA-binding transcriptional ArsR family regulator